MERASVNQVPVDMDAKQIRMLHENVISNAMDAQVVKLVIVSHALLMHHGTICANASVTLAGQERIVQFS